MLVKIHPFARQWLNSAVYVYRDNCRGGVLGKNTVLECMLPLLNSVQPASRANRSKYGFDVGMCYSRGNHGCDG